MKRLAVFVAAAVIAGAVVLFITRSEKPKEQPTDVTRLQAELAQKEAQIKELEVNRERAEKQARQIAQLSDDIAAKAKERESALSNSLTERAKVLAEKAAASGKADDSKSGLGGMLSGMMKDPEMRKLIRDQQAMVMEQLYSPLLKKLNLAPEQSEKFKEILANGMESGMEMASSMFGGGSTNRAEMGKAIAAQQKAQEQQMKDLLGEQGFAQYKEYQETVGERAQLNQFRQQFGDQGINDDQTEKLLALMREEKKNMTATMGTQFPGQNPGDMDAFMKEGQLEKLMEAQQNVNQNVYARAGEILNPEQMASFGKFQTNQLMMMRMGLSMARKFMGGENAGQEQAPK